MKLFSIVAAIILLSIGVFFTMGGVVNTETSIPSGLYWKVDKPLAVGRIVMFCPPNQPIFQEARDKGRIAGGACPDNYAMMKLQVAAKRKDVISVNENGVSVNGALLPDSKPVNKDSAQALTAMSIINHELKANEVLLMSSMPDNAFDGRHFGFIDVDQIDSVIDPLWQF